MQQRLESYLTEVERELRAVPATQRNEELREIRQHLLDNVTVNQELLGYDEELAVATAIEEFGAPKKLAGEILTVWRRGDRKANRGRIWSAAFCATVCVFPAFSALRALMLVMADPLHRLPGSAVTHDNFLMWATLNWAIAAAIAGSLFAKRANMRFWIGVAIFYTGFAVASKTHALHEIPLTAAYMAVTATWTALWATVALRWRKNRERKRDAASISVR